MREINRRLSAFEREEVVLQNPPFMSRKGNCLDNSVMENLFGLLKSKLLYLREFSSIEEFRIDLEKYMDYYKNKRMKAKLKGLRPVQYRIQSPTAALLQILSDFLGAEQLSG